MMKIKAGRGWMILTLKNIQDCTGVTVVQKTGYIYYVLDSSDKVYTELTRGNLKTDDAMSFVLPQFPGVNSSIEK